MTRRRRSLTDDEWMQKTDPEAWEHQQLMDRLDRLEATVERLTGLIEDGQTKPPTVGDRQRQVRVNTL